MFRHPDGRIGPLPTTVEVANESTESRGLGACMLEVGGPVCVLDKGYVKWYACVSADHQLRSSEAIGGSRMSATRVATGGSPDHQSDVSKALRHAAPIVSSIQHGCQCCRELPDCVS